MLKFIQGGDEEDEEEKEEVDELIDMNFDIKEKEFDEEDNIVMGGGDAVLSAVIASFLGLQGMAISVFLAFLVGSVMGAVYLFVDMKKRHVLHTIKKTSPGWLFYGSQPIDASLACLWNDGRLA